MYISPSGDTHDDCLGLSMHPKTCGKRETKATRTGRARNLGSGLISLIVDLTTRPPTRCLSYRAWLPRFRMLVLRSANLPLSISTCMNFGIPGPGTPAPSLISYGSDFMRVFPRLFCCLVGDYLGNFCSESVWLGTSRFLVLTK